MYLNVYVVLVLITHILKLAVKYLRNWRENTFYSHNSRSAGNKIVRESALFLRDIILAFERVQQCCPSALLKDRSSIDGQCGNATARPVRAGAPSV